MNTKTVGMVLLGGVMLAGCGGTQPAEKKPATPPATTPTTVPPTSVSTPSGSAATGSLPADFPKDVPVYAGTTVVAGGTAAPGSGAVFSTSDAPDKVVAFYKEELPKNGWSKPMAVDLANISSISATKENRQLGISITKGQDGKTTITIGVGTKP